MQPTRFEIAVLFLSRGAYVVIRRLAQHLGLQIHAILQCLSAAGGPKEVDEVRSRTFCVATLFSALLLSPSAAEGPANGSPNRTFSEMASSMVVAQLAHIKL